jgi:hypothetical protein
VALREIADGLITPALLDEPAHPVIEDEIDADDLAILTEPAEPAESAEPEVATESTEDNTATPEASQAPEPPKDES